MIVLMSPNRISISLKHKEKLILFSLSTPLKAKVDDMLFWLVKLKGMKRNKRRVQLPREGRMMSETYRERLRTRKGMLLSIMHL